MATTNVLHKHYHILQAIARGEQIEIRAFGNFNKWHVVENPLDYFRGDKYEFRVHKSHHLNINGFEIPAPAYEPLNINDTYWLVDIYHERAEENSWQGTEYELRWLSSGLIHLSSEAAFKHVQALLSFTKVIK